MCCDYECPVGYINIHGSIGDTEEECCESACGEYSCSCGWTPKENQDSIMGMRGDATCCDEWCGDFACPAGQRNIGEVLGVPDAELCCESCACSNCKVCGADATKCEQCMSGFRLDLVSQTCQACDENDCSCWPGTRLNLTYGTCESCEAANCVTCCADAARCDFCLPGHQLDAITGSCSAPVCLAPNCKRDGPDGVCRECNDGFYVDDGRCKACAAENCVSCKSDPSKCDSCKAAHSVDAETGLCAPCAATTECLSCSQNLSHCDVCRDGFRLDWFNGVCLECLGRNCKTCNHKLGLCDSCYPGFVGDKKTGHCLAKQPLPIEGRCEGLEGPFEFVTGGTCGKTNHWLGCDEADAGPSGCYQAAMADPRCRKDYFTYNVRGDGNCGCKTSKEEPVKVYVEAFSDCYMIKNTTYR